MSCIHCGGVCKITDSDEYCGGRRWWERYECVDCGATGRLTIEEDTGLEMASGCLGSDEQ